MKTVSGKTRSLRERCLREAMAIIEEAGIEALSLREVARRLRVSHQAPYKHFPSRDHLIAEVVGRTFAEFARHLDARPQNADPHADLRAMGEAYLGYALRHPLQYARHAFSLLCGCIRRMYHSAGSRPSRTAVETEAMFVWSTMHGLASILQGNVVNTLGLPPGLRAEAAPEVLKRIGRSLAAGIKPRRRRG
jgi:AcrR family transcriptional regulator